MVRFDAHAPGTSSERWATDPRLLGLPDLELDDVNQLVVVAAHPDDETLAAGGLIATCSQRGIPVQVVVVTDGGGSHPRSSTHTVERLRDLRDAELRSAVRRLAPEAGIVQLGLPDGGIEHEPDRLRAALDDLFSRVDAGALVVSTWAGDGHRDHRLVGEAVEAAASRLGLRSLGFPLWFWHWAEPDDAPWADSVSLRLGDVAAERKRLAVSEYRSQTEPLSSLPEDRRVLEPGVLEHFRRADEVFVTHRDASAAADATGAMPADYFERLYARRDDPWRFEERWYESRKRALTLGMLSRERYRTVLELGCSIGVLTEQLAARADRVLGLDISQRAVEIARARLGGSDGVELRQADVTRGLPDGPFDLIVVSEIGYYLDTAALDALIDRITSSAAPDADILVCHWRHPVADYRLTGDQVHARVLDRLPTPRLAAYLDDDVAIDLYSGDVASVARRTGLA